MQDKPVLSPEQQKVLQEMLEQYKPDLLRFAALADAAYLGYRDAVRAAAPAVAQLLKVGTEWIKKVDWVQLAEVGRTLSELPDRSKKAMKLAADNGWFFGWNDSLKGILKLIKSLEATGTAPVTADAVDQVFKEYFEENFEAIAQGLVRNYAHRTEPINAAVAAHKSDALSGAYFLSIPVFLAQADGILSEVVGINSVFQKGGRDKLIAKVAGWDLVSDVKGLLQPFEEFHKLDLVRGKNDDQPNAFTALNRHEVMHGNSQTYGTRINSLKAFSLLAFVGLHVPLVLDKVKRAEEAATKAAATSARPTP